MMGFRRGLHRRLGIAALAAGVAFLVSAGPAAANVFNTYGAGARNIAMGNATIASQSDWGATFTNPAGLAFSEHTEWTIGVLGAAPRLTVQYRGQRRHPVDAFSGPGRHKDIETNIGPVVGTVLNGEKMLGRKLDYPFAVGVAVYLPGESAFGQRTFQNKDLFSVMFSERNLALGLATSLGIKLHPNFSAGIGMIYNLALKLDARAAVTQDFHTLQETDANTQWSPTFVAGFQFRPTDRLFIGASYTGLQRWNSKGLYRSTALTVDLGTPLIPVVPIGGAVEIAPSGPFYTSFTPKTLQLAVAYKFSERLEVDVGVTWRKWDEYHTTLRTPPPNAFKNTWTPRIGAEYRVTPDFLLRGGFYYEPTPVTEQPTGFNLLGTDRYVPSVGLSWNFRDPFGYLSKPLTIDVAAFWHIFQTRRFDQHTGPPPLSLLQADPQFGLLALLVPNFASFIDVDEPHTFRGQVFGGTADLTFRW
ncbi:MAG: TonB-dependent receptor [Myxococcales bacterium]|nr:TonB-dependent receptor [Myxococcales bacterium]